MAIAGDGTQWLNASFGGTAANLYPFTVSGWYYLLNTTADLSIGGFGNSSTSGSAAIVTSAGFPRANAVDDSGANWAQPTGPTSYTAAWVPAVAVFLSASSRTIYNKARVATANTTVTNTTSTYASVSVLAQDVGGPSWVTPAGSFVAEFAIWTAGLGTAEIYSILQGANPLTIRRNNVFCYFPLRDSLTDYGPNGLGLQPQTANAITWGNHPPVPPFRQTRPYNFLSSQQQAATTLPYARRPRVHLCR